MGLYFRVKYNVIFVSDSLNTRILNTRRAHISTSRVLGTAVYRFMLVCPTYLPTTVQRVRYAAIQMSSVFKTLLSYPKTHPPYV